LGRSDFTGKAPRPPNERAAGIADVALEWLSRAVR